MYNEAEYIHFEFFFKEKFSIWVCFSKRFLRKRIKFATKFFFEKNLNSEKLFLLKKNNSKSKSSKHIVSWKENFLNKVSKKIFFRKKFTEKKSFRKNISKLTFLQTVYYKKKFTKIFLINWKKKIL